LLDSAVAGTTNVSTDADVTLTTTTGAANTAREAILLFSGARTALRTVTAPAQSKIYTVINATTGGFSVKLVGAGPTTGLTIPNGASATVAWNGSDFVEVGSGSIGNLTVNGTLTVTGATTLQSTLAVTGNITNTAGTANGVTYLNGSKVLTSGSALVFDGTNLGIGTSSPSQKLEVAGNIYINTSGNPYLQIKTSGAGNNPSIRMQADTNYWDIQSTFSNTNDDLLFQYNGTALLDLDKNGNLGLGVTPSAWGGVYAPAFQLRGAALSSQSNANITHLTQNTYFNSSNAATYIATDNAVRYTQYQGQHQFFTAPSGTAGNAITFTQAMTLAANGNLGIGNTSPDTTLAIGSSAGSGSNGLGIYLARGATTNLFEAYDGTKSFIAGTDSSNASVKVGSLSNHPVAIVQANGAAIYIDTSKNVGIGTTSPAVKLEIGGTNPTINIGATNSASGAALSYNTSGNYFSINAVTQGVGYRNIALANDGGSVGVGTTSPATKIDARGVVSAMSTGVDGTFQPAFNATYSGDTTFYGTIAHSMSSAASSSGFRFLGGGTSNIAGAGGQQKLLDITRGATIFYTGDTERARIDSSGNFGIGTTSISSKVYIAGGTNDQLLRVGNTNAVGTQYISIYANGAEAVYNSVNTQNSVYGSHIWNATNNGGTVERARINSSGQFLIGGSSTAGQEKLRVTGTGVAGTSFAARFNQDNTSDGSATLIGLSVEGSNWSKGAIGFVRRTSYDVGDLVFCANSVTSTADVTLSDERMRLTYEGNLLVGITSNNASTPVAYFNSTGSGSDGMWVANTNVAAATVVVWNKATSGNNFFQAFFTETAVNQRGSITYNRAGGVVLYNTTSDYRAKDISGPVTGSGALIDSVPVYMGKMKGATQERPMFIAHETPAYAHTGEKDAVDKDGNPVYQQMDASALIPVMWAEIQSLRKRLADAGI
jgi:hypothetical protein